MSKNIDIKFDFEDLLIIEDFKYHFKNINQKIKVLITNIPCKLNIHHVTKTEKMINLVSCFTVNKVFHNEKVGVS